MYPPDDPQEMAAFMRMFMDLVGVFNDDPTKVNITVSGTPGGKGGVTFGMLFGDKNKTTEDEWSTEDDDQGMTFIN